MFICQPLGLLINIGLIGETILKSVKLADLDTQILIIFWIISKGTHMYTCIIVWLPHP